MIFKFHSFELLPWGASLRITCTSSSRNVKTISNWKSTTSYSTTYGDLGKNRSFFIESKKQPISMTYTCTSTNGNLVSISTNLQYTIDETYNYSGLTYIKKFTIKNDDWFNTPYDTQTMKINKTIVNTKIIPTKIPRSPNSNTYTQFSKGGNRIYSNTYSTTTNEFIFNSADVPVNTSITTHYQSLFGETTITGIAESYNSYVRVYVDNNQILFESPISSYNESTKKSISYVGYSSANDRYYYYYRTTQASVGDRITINYNCYEWIDETLIATEAKEYSTHTGTISSANSNKIIEDCISNENQLIPYTRNGRIISISTADYDNTNIIVRFEKEKPYIKLCCNKVKIESRFVEVGINSNGFSNLDKDNTYVKPYSRIQGITTKATLLRYPIVSWNIEESNQLYYGEKNDQEKYGANKYYFYGFFNNTYQQLKYIGNHDTTSYTYKIPKIQTLNEPYYSIGYIVNFEGESKYYCNSEQYIDGNITVYTEDGYLKVYENSSNKTFKRDYNTGIPTIYSLSKWGNNVFYKIDDYDDEYISPADGYIFKTNWEVECSIDCGSDCGIDCGEGCNGDGGGGYQPWNGKAVGGYNVWSNPYPNDPDRVYVGGPPAGTALTVTDQKNGHYEITFETYNTQGEWEEFSGWILTDGVTY